MWIKALNYSEALEYLDGIIRTGIKYDLVNIRRLLGLLDHPERRFPIVCVAGTNGKGSVCAFLESVLAEAGYKAGLNTSPHLVTPRERIRINREQATPGEFAEALTDVREAASSGWVADDPGRPTFFETMTSAALTRFRRAGVDIAILETGLGGRLDATNATQPVLSIITRIAIDHPKTLGDRLKKIAFEKAGIARRGRPLLIGKQRHEVGRHLARLARFRGARPVGLHSRWSREGGVLALTTPHNVYRGISLGLSGETQLENAACAVRAAELLRPMGFDIGEQAIIKGLEKAYWPGRLELRDIEGRRVLMDCAHNPNGMRSLVRELKRIPASRRILIFAAMADKNVQSVINSIFPISDVVILPPLPQRRAADPKDLVSLVDAEHPNISIADSVAEAWKAAGRMSREDDLIIVTGSLYLVGEFKKAIGKNPG